MKHISSQDWHNAAGTVRDDNNQIVAECVFVSDGQKTLLSSEDRDRNAHAIAELPAIFRLLDDIDTAFATLKVGRDYKDGITPQAAEACADVWHRINELFGRIEGRPGPADRARIIKKHGKNIFDGGTSP